MTHVNTTVRVDETRMRKLRLTSAMLGVSQGELLRRALDDVIERESRNPEVAAILRAAA